MRFIIVITVYNAELYIGKCIDSVMSQINNNYDVIIVDDCSTDRTWDIICSSGFRSFRNSERNGSSLFNMIKGIEMMNIDPEDVIISVDGDDYLAYNNTLTHLDKVYNDKDVWLTYGQYFPLSGISKDRSAIVLDTRAYRKSRIWSTSHLKTFKKWLWDKIDKKDFLDADGNYFCDTADRAFMYPMIEMAGSHARFISEILYMYNDISPLNEFRQVPYYGEEIADYIISKPEYKELLNK